MAAHTQLAVLLVLALSTKAILSKTADSAVFLM